MSAPTIISSLGHTPDFNNGGWAADSVAFTPASAPDAVLVFWCSRGTDNPGVPPDITSMTYGGVSMTQEHRLEDGIFSLAVFSLLSPPTGTQTVAMTWGVSKPQHTFMHIIAIAGCDTTTLLEAIADYPSGTTDITGSITTLTDDALVIDLAESRNVVDITPGANQTALTNAASGSSTVSETSTRVVVTASSVTNTWTGGANRFDGILVSVKPAGGAGVITIDPDDLSTSPIFSSSSLSQNHVISPASLGSAPSLSLSSIGSLVLVSPNNLTTTPSLQSPGFVRNVILAVQNLLTSLQFSLPDLSQNHILASQNLQTTPTLQASQIDTNQLLSPADVATSIQLSIPAASVEYNLQPDPLTLHPQAQAALLGQIHLLSPNNLQLNLQVGVGTVSPDGQLFSGMTLRFTGMNS